MRNDLEVTVSKSELLKKLKANRLTHRKTFEKAVEVYNEKVLDWHKKQVESLLKEGDLREQYAHFRVPEEHTADYDAIISMLEMHVKDQFVIGFSEYQNFVLDQWSWSAAFAGNTTAYLVDVES